MVEVERSHIIKVLFGIPDEGHTEPEAYDNRMEMCMRLGALQVLSSHGEDEYLGKKYHIEKGKEFNFGIAVVGKVFTALAREKIAEYAVDEDFDYLFMVDDDMLVPADLFECLYQHNVDIVAPLAFTRNSPHKPVLYNLEQGIDPVTNQSYYINYPVINYPKDQLVECDAVGFGSVLIKTSVLRAMKKPWFMSTSGAGEDIHFCHQARKAGFRVFMDTATKLAHLGYPKVITEETYEEESNIKALRDQYGNDRKYAAS